MKIAAHPQLLDAFQLIRSQNVEEASERMGRVFSPHRLELRDSAARLDLTHNQVRLRDVSLNFLQYGTPVLIDPGERGDFYMIQLPLRGSAQVVSGGTEVRSDTQTLSVLQPRTRSRMTWSGDCAMILVQAPCRVLRARALTWGIDKPQEFGVARRYVLNYRPNEIWVVFNARDDILDASPVFSPPPLGPTFRYAADGQRVEDIVFGYRDPPLVAEAISTRKQQLERRFGIDFDRACKVLDELQQAGLIGPYIGGRSRDILLTREEWLPHAPHA